MMNTQLPRPCIEEVQDYREFLLELFLWNKRMNRRHSYRFFAAKLGMDAAHVHRILNGKKHLPLKSVPRVVERLKLDPEAAQMLIGKVEVAQGRSPARAKGALIFPQAAARETSASQGGVR